MCPSKKAKQRHHDQSDSSSDSDQELETFSSSSPQLDSNSVASSHVDSTEEQTRRNSVIRHPPEQFSNPKDDETETIFDRENRVRNLEVEKEALLGDLGEMVFNQQRKKKEERSSEIFHQIFPSSSNEFNHRPGSGNSSKDGDGYLNDRQSSLDGRNEMNWMVSAAHEGTGTDPGQNKMMQIGGSQRKEKESGKKSKSGRNTDDPLPSSSRDETYDETLASQGYADVSFPIQQGNAKRKEFISLACKPQSSVARTLYNNYKLLLRILSQMFLSPDVEELKNWASEKFSIENAQNATEVFSKLDEKGAINAEDLSQLRGFFESIIRLDLVHIIDEFLCGDYSLLQNLSRGQISPYNRDSCSRGFLSSTPLRNRGTLGKAQNNNEVVFSRTPNESQSTARVQQDLNPPATGHPFQGVTPLIKTTTQTTNIKRSTRTSQSSTVGGNAQKHSKLHRPRIVSSPCSPSTSRNLQAPNQGRRSSCVHYKRHCFVKFECCDQFWPCHRCHNNESTCGRKNLKSHDVHMIKCLHCHKKQQFGEFCCQCGKKFSDYFCGLCKHVTGNDNDPFHCEKCGICRVEKHRLVHCDGCGVCLDVQFYRNHRCTSLEVAFTGCQTILSGHQGPTKEFITQGL
ncbi:uncharacterized protein LOC114516913 [Dendronephthya gigantea]|uniref:uncharacterized protein LOC114516913 n=1 Tax=Dendronephthya gigantea TaxID=151771 RepID=UPI001069703D|nr:uncharacterized protein LOC114516913 [Dendronephthya gigantea]XP_028392324.1 uncharacterized protein LOC114516913 [Dendronephthya gigantea]